jgi:Amt family ammonium transporter
MVYKKFKDGEWDILRVNEFVRSYTEKLSNKGF